MFSPFLLLPHLSFFEENVELVKGVEVLGLELGWNVGAGGACASLKARWD